jgi:hypothetical protein
VPAQQTSLILSIRTLPHEPLNSFHLAKKCKSFERANFWLANLNTLPLHKRTQQRRQRASLAQKPGAKICGSKLLRAPRAMKNQQHTTQHPEAAIVFILIE